MATPSTIVATKVDTGTIVSQSFLVTTICLSLASLLVAMSLAFAISVA